MFSLPIDAIEGEFKQRLGAQPLLVEAATGSGKSSRLPIWAAEQGRVLVVQPRRIACEALAGFVGEQAKHLNVGYAIRFASTVKDDTDVAFVTPGIALRWLAENKLQAYSVIILDEFHERRWDSDVLLALLKGTTKTLVVTSATLSTQSLLDYLDAQHLQAQGRSFPISTHYLAKESHYLPQADSLTQRVSLAIKHALESSEGDILVFLPGRAEIQACVGAINCPKGEVLVLDASISAEQRRYLLQRPENAPQRVILSTNVAETSLTLPAISVVIDSGLERRTGQRNGRTVLSLQRISKASAEQRKGRAGRVQAGLCYRLWGEFAPFEAFTPPQMQREELIEPMLYAASCGYPLGELDFIEALPDKSLLLAQQQLQKMAAFDSQGRLSKRGQGLLRVPLDSCFADLINLMPDAVSRAAMVDVCAALSVNRRLFSLPKEQHQLQALAKLCPEGCDVMLLLRVMRHYPLDDCLNIHQEAVQQARQLATQLRQVLALPTLAESVLPERCVISDALLTGAEHLAFVRREKRPDAMSNGQYEVLVARDSYFSTKHQAALVLDQFSLAGRGIKQVNNMALCLMPISFDDLASHGLGDLQSIGLKQGKSIMQRCYAGRVIASEQQRATPEQIRQGLAQAILRGKKLKPAGALLVKDIAAWNLWCSLGDKLGGGEGDPLEPNIWLEQQLLDLGLEQEADIHLLEPNDILFDGIPEWRREEFDQRFPQRLHLAELSVDIEYKAAQKLVVLHYARGRRKDGPKRWELPRWQGWRIIYQKASKRVNLK